MMPSTIHITLRLLSLIALLASPAQATMMTGLRGGGRQLDLINETPFAAKNCLQELRMVLECQGDCNFTAQKGTCESKLFFYHGGPCPGTTDSASASASDSAANCQDFHQGPPRLFGEPVFVVVSDVKDPAKNSSMWTSVGGYFMTQYQDYPIGLGLSDQQNITVYASNETTFDNMLQTMLFYSPCEGTPLEDLDSDQSVQLLATAVDPQIRALFHLRIASQTAQSWQLKAAAYATSTAGMDTMEDVVLSELESTTTVGDIEIPIVVELNRNDTINILSSATLVTASGLECGLSTFYTSATAVTQDRNGEDNNNPDAPLVWP